MVVPSYNVFARTDAHEHLSSVQLGSAYTSLSQQLHSILSLNLKVTGGYSGIQEGVRHPSSAVRTPVPRWHLGKAKRDCLNYSACAIYSVLQGLVPLDEREHIALCSFSSRVTATKASGQVPKRDCPAQEPLSATRAPQPQCL